MKIHELEYWDFGTIRDVPIRFTYTFRSDVWEEETFQVTAFYAGDVVALREFKSSGFDKSPKAAAKELLRKIHDYYKQKCDPNGYR